MLLSRLTKGLNRAQGSLQTRKSTLKGQESRNREVISNKGGDLLKVVPKGQPEGLSVMVVQREKDIC